MKKIMLFEGDIETQGYFSIQLAEAFQKMGHQTFIYDLSRPWNSSDRFFRFFERGNTVLVNFNFHGMSGEDYFLDENDRMMWDALDIPSYNIVVDHPMYYHHFLEKVPRGYHHISIDRNHEKYMERFFPNIRRGPFIPLAGTELYPNKTYVPAQYRRYDVTMVGNYTPPAQFEKYITRIDDEYTEFYYGMIDDLLANPMRTLEDVAQEHILREIPEVTEEELKKVMSKLTFVDLYVRFKTRGEAVKVLAEAGIKVNVFGGGWDKLSCQNPENMIIGGSLDSVGCLKKLCQSKISLNVMPWFRDGAHDRIFNSMLNGALCLTDSSVYLDAILHDKTDCRIYSTAHLEELPDMVYGLLANPPRLQEIIDNGYRLAKAEHTWEHRATVLHDLIESDK
ncbi:MAG: glycosyltransferase family 1 protein [Lachnospiraceae bacterium]|nr:glycosyltransferase family 1 protein [Lachnospiraceae bacterium]